MDRQKIRLLRQLSGSEILRVLPAKALKLYLVLLVSAQRVGRKESIEVQVIQRALGNDLTRRELLRIGAALWDHDLATLRPSSRPQKSGGRRDAWSFRVLREGIRRSDVQGKARPSRPGCGR